MQSHYVSVSRGPAALALPLAVAAIALITHVAYAQAPTTGRFSGGAGSPDPGMAGTQQNEQNAPKGPGTLVAPNTGGLGGPTNAPISGPSGGSLAAPPAASGANTGMLPRARSRTPVSPEVGGIGGGGSSSLGGAAGLGDGSAGLRGGSSGLSGGTDGTSGLGGTPQGARNPPPVLGGSQPPSNPTCGTLAGQITCAKP